MGMAMERAEKLYERTFIGRVGWLITLRWFAILALAFTAGFFDRLFPIRLTGHARVLIMGVVVLIAVYNLLLLRRLRQITRLISTNPATVLAGVKNLIHIQIIADLVCLSVILDLSGGLLNPLCIFMIFHVAIAGIILPRYEAFGVALFSGLLLAVLGVLNGVFPASRIPLEGFPLERIVPPLTRNWFYVFSVCFTFSSTFVLIAYFTTSVSVRLREVLYDLEQANMSLRRQDESLTRFLRTASHQLRSPLAAIVSLISAYLTTQQTQSLPPQFQDLLRRIQHRSRSLMDLVDDLLRLTQIREGLDHQEVKPVNIHQCIMEYCQPFKIQAQEKGLEFVVALDPRAAAVLAREQDISDIVENLVSNAVKYTDTGRILIEGRPEGNSYLFCVSDTGMGIPENDRHHLFEEFFRAANAQKKFPHSSGLGLHITRTIVARLNGTIELTSQLGHGTSFRVTIPLLNTTKA